VPDRYDDLSDDAIVAHDRQRAMPDNTLQELIIELRSRIGEGPCLDAGAGTGAIAIPLATAGTPVIGLDLSRAMLRELRARLREDERVPLVRGDVTCLPFADDTFAAVHCAHTLHLVMDWRKALAELIRVTAIEGILMFGLGGGLSTISMLQDIQWRFQQELGEIVRDAPAPGPASEEEFTEAMTLLVVTPLPAIELRYEQTTSVEIDLHRLEHNVFGRSINLGQDLFRHAADRTRAWAVDRFGSLDEPLARNRTLTYHVFRKESR